MQKNIKIGLVGYIQRYSLFSTAFKPILCRVVDISKNYNLGDFYSLYIAFFKQRENLNNRSIPVGYTG